MIKKLYIQPQHKWGMRLASAYAAHDARMLQAPQTDADSVTKQSAYQSADTQIKKERNHTHTKSLNMSVIQNLEMHKWILHEALTPQEVASGAHVFVSEFSNKRA